MSGSGRYPEKEPTIGAHHPSINLQQERGCIRIMTRGEFAQVSRVGQSVFQVGRETNDVIVRSVGWHVAAFLGERCGALMKRRGIWVSGLWRWLHFHYTPQTDSLIVRSRCDASTIR
ncbi:hypothetical protein C8R48DRAFT_703788 [Suillus tomentosus]|nr:hypothetical protein C8R48DRAFT_703788 [Suillus tomentosus]